MDYYDILGLDRNASDDDIKKAFRKLAKQYHPDLNPGNPEAEAKFKEVNEAYSILSDPDQKSHYDRFGSVQSNNTNYDPGAGFNFNFGGGFDPSSFFDEFFGARRQTQPFNTSINATLQITLKEFLLGCKKTVEITKSIFCNTCNGEGGSNPQICTYCMGKGVQLKRIQQGPFVMQQTIPCDFCQGAGKSFQNKCNQCDASGKVSKNEMIEINVPVNCPLNATLQISNHGNQENKNYAPGSFNVTLSPTVENISNVTREGSVHFIKEISIEDWYNNREVQINRFDVDYVTYDLSKLNQSDKRVVFSGKGLRSATNDSQGDFIVTFRITK